MKLERCALCVVFAVVTGCASRPAASPISTTTTTGAPVATTTATVEEPSVRSGKAQRTDAATTDDTDDGLGEPDKAPGRDDGRRGGGFSGWK